jgi:hypothetical protein
MKHERDSGTALLEPLELDPHDFLGPRDARILPGLTRAQRIAVTGHVVKWLAEHPDKIRISAAVKAPCFDDIRDLPVDDRGTTVVRLLNDTPELDGLELARLVDLLLGLCGRAAALRRQLEALAILETVLPAPAMHDDEASTS